MKKILAFTACLIILATASQAQSSPKKDKYGYNSTESKFNKPASTSSNTSNSANTNNSSSRTSTSTSSSKSPSLYERKDPPVNNSKPTTQSTQKPEPGKVWKAKQ